MSKIRQRFTAILLALVAAAGITLVVASPASADVWLCPSGQGCIFSGPDGTGSKLTAAFSVYGTSCHNLPTWLDNNTYSAVSLYGSGYGMHFYNAYDCDTSQSNVFLPPNHTVDFGWPFIQGDGSHISSWKISMS